MTATDRKWADLVARNLTLPGLDPGKPTPPARQLPAQKPCDIGLFGDGPAQIDLVDYLNQQQRG